MKVKHLVIGAVVLAAGALAVHFFTRDSTKPEVLLERQVLKMVSAAEKRDIPALLEHISERFRTHDGIGRRELGGYVLTRMRDATWLRIFTSELNVQLQSPSSAKVSGKFIFGRSEAKSLAELAGQTDLTAYLIELSAELEEDGEWRFVSARHSRISSDQLY